MIFLLSSVVGVTIFGSEKKEVPFYLNQSFKIRTSLLQMRAANLERAEQMREEQRREEEARRRFEAMAEADYQEALDNEAASDTSALTTPELARKTKPTSKFSPKTKVVAKLPVADENNDANPHRTNAKRILDFNE